MDIRTRIAPSPTGRMHIGTVRTALFNYLFARHHGGAYVVRIEDTDKERSKPEFEASIWTDFAWLSLKADETYRQSEHLPRHQELLKQLIDADRAYVSKELAKDGSGREVSVVRLRNPGTTVTFTDVVRGEISVDTTELGDFVIARAVDDPLYHFAVVVDDGDERISHVIRGDDHIANTPRQILIQEALNLPRPVYAHLPLILAPDRSKLSKRKHNASIDVYQDQGFLPEAILNFLALLGWNPGTEQEIFTLDELVRSFSLEGIQKSGATFSNEKLRWFNREHLLRMDEATFAREAQKHFEQATKMHPSATQLPYLTAEIKERIHVWSDLAESASTGAWDFLHDSITYEPSALAWKKGTPEATKKHLQALIKSLAPVDPWTPEQIKAATWGYAEEVGRGEVLWPMRYALTGKERSPDPFTVSALIGKAKTLERLENALSAL